MRIGVDGQCFSVGKRHGFTTYVGSLLDGLRRVTPGLSCVLWEATGRSTWRLPHQVWWDQVSVPAQAVRDRVELIHVPAFSGAILRPCPLVLTVMDLIYTKHPEWLPSRRARWYWGRWIPFTARRATAVIAPSQATKQDLVQLAGIPPSRITVIPLAVDSRFLRRPPAADVLAYRARRGLTDPYILYVGAIDRRKDFEGLLQAFALVRPARKPIRLVIAGHHSPGRSRLPALVAESGYGQDITCLGFIPDQELRLLYAGASLFVYPSREEGFGLPPLEAMAMGVPVISYRTSSLPEVVGNAAILIDPPFTPERLARAIEQVLGDDRVSGTLIARGQARIGQWTWDEIAEQTLGVYRSVLG